jgi:hypothetical protein
MKNRKFDQLIRKINLYPPFLGMGIKVRSFSEDHTRFEVELRQKWYNRNLFGTHFGGCLYSMTDPFFVFIVTMNLGKDYIVWDKSAAGRAARVAEHLIHAATQCAHRPHQEILQRDAVAAHQQRALRLECLHERRRARVGLRRAAALHLDGGQPRPACTTKSTSWLRSRQ